MLVIKLKVITCNLLLINLLTKSWYTYQLSPGKLRR